MPVLALILFLVLGGTASADIYKYVDENGVILFSDSNGKDAVKVPNSGYSSQSYVTVPDEELDRLIKKNCEKYSMPYELIKAVIKAESNFNPYAVSPKGAQGLMQLMPQTAYSMGVYNPMDVEANIEGGVRYLKLMLEKFGGNKKLALAAYNAGPEAVEKYGTVPPYKETREYVDKVISISGGKDTNTSYKDTSTETARKPEPAKSPEPKSKAKQPAAKAVKVKAQEKPALIYKVVQDDGTVLYTNSLPQRF